MRTRFFCCLMFGICVETPAPAGAEMVPEPRRPSGRGDGGIAPYAPSVDDERRARERLERLRARNERRQARGESTWDPEQTIEGWPISTDAADQPTMILRPLRGEPPEE